MSKFKKIKLTYENGETSITDINPNCTDESIINHFLGKYYNIGAFVDDETEGENMQLCVKVEIIPQNNFPLGKEFEDLDQFVNQIISEKNV